MPELPEVQTIADDLNRKVKGLKITDFWTDWPKSVKQPSINSFKKSIRGSKIERVRRIGKNIVFDLDKEKILLVHQKMTGHLMVGKWRVSRGKVIPLTKGALEERVNQYIHSLFTFNNGIMIGFSDMRKFGSIVFGTKAEILSLKSIQTLGIDALDDKLTVEILENIFSRSKRSIKLTLMDPKVIAGIGNIYADEILWSAKVHPLRQTNEISRKEIKEILKYIKIILSKALSLRGSSVGDYRDASGNPGLYSANMLVYKQTNHPCKRCRTPIQKTKAGQRSAHFCPQCQKK